MEITSKIVDIRPGLVLSLETKGAHVDLMVYGSTPTTSISIFGATAEQLLALAQEIKEQANELLDRSGVEWERE